jgi:hypothetical protein
MKLTRFITAAAVALLPLGAGATNLIIPAAGTGPGANGSTWQTEIMLHNATSRTASVIMTFHDREGADKSFTQIVGPRQTVAINDVVRTIFLREAATGAITITDTDSDPRNLAVTSRTSNVTEAGEFGQDIPAVEAADATNVGGIVAITGPSSVSAFRFNFGVYAAADATVQWELIRASGASAGVVLMDYRGGTQIQYNQGVASLFGAEPLDRDVIHASVTKGSAVFYGSLVHQDSGDPSFVPAIPTFVEPRLRLLGVDRNDNGSIDIADEDQNGVLDAAIDSNTMGFPTFFRILAESDGDAAMKYEIVSSTADANLADSNGLVQLVPSIALKGTTGELKVRVTSAGQTRVITIPVNFV